MNALFMLMAMITHTKFMCDTEEPQECLEHICASPKVYVFSALSSEKIYGPFFCCEETITGFVYLDTLMNFLLPQTSDEDPT
jgi:hypothetical protein